MANTRKLTDQYLSYMRYREMHFQTEYIFTTCKEIKKEPPEEIVMIHSEGLFSS